MKRRKRVARFNTDSRASPRNAPSAESYHAAALKMTPQMPMMERMRKVVLLMAVKAQELDPSG